MKYVKMLGLAAVAAMALMAFAAGSASATELCKAKETPTCSSANMVTSGTTIKATSTNVAFVAGFATVKCTSSTIEGPTTNTGSSTETVGVVITTLDFNGCTDQHGNPCHVTSTANGSLEIHTDSGSVDHNGKLTGKNSRVTLTCVGVSCIFGTAAGGTELGTMTGAAPAAWAAKASLPYFTGDASEFVCTLGAGFGIFTANYTITGPNPLYVI